MTRSLLRASSKLRILFDLAWVVSFVVVMVMLYGGREGKAALDGSVRLDLPLGEQVRGIYLREQRVGQSVLRIERHHQGWRITQHFAAVAGEEAIDVGWSRLVLRKDLSLQTIAISADPGRLAQLMGVSGSLAKLLGGGEIKLHGSCQLRSGRCQMQGRLGGRRVDQSILAGRGPVVPSALFPLLVRGVLGKRADLVVFDALSLARKVVTYEIVGREAITIRDQRYQAIRVRQDLEGMPSSLWLDEQGRVLKEDLPMGLSLQHEVWR